MEKAHGWTYVRSKNNGRKGKKSQAGQTPPTPRITTPQSYTMDVSTPLSREPPSPYDQYGVYTGAYSVGGSTSASEEITPYSNGSVIDDTLNGFEGQYGQSEPNFDFNDFPGALDPPDHLEYSPASNDLRRPSFDAASMTDAPPIPSFDTSMTLQDQEHTLGNFNWSHMDNDFTSHNIQMITPASSVDNRPLSSFAHNPSISLHQPTHAPIPSLSPGAQGNIMLYSPHSPNDIAADEGFDEFVGETGKPTTDFALYDGSHGTSSFSSAADEGMFQELSTFGGQFAPTGWSGRGTELAQQFGMGDLMQLDDEYDD